MSNNAKRRAAKKKAQKARGAAARGRVQASAEGRKTVHVRETADAQDGGALDRAVNQLQDQAASVPSSPRRSGATLTEVRSALNRLERDQLALEGAVRAAHLDGHSWAVIGEQFGISRQAARQRFGHLVVSESTAQTAAGELPGVAAASGEPPATAGALGGQT